MENIEEDYNEEWKHFEKKNQRGKLFAGMLIVVIGGLYLAKELGAELPFWLLSWKMLLIGIGLVLAFKHKFMHAGWVILVGVGGILILGDIYPEMNMTRVLWPLLVIVLGLYIMFKPRNKYKHLMHKRWKQWHDHKHYHGHWSEGKPDQNVGQSKDDYLESTCVMGGVKKNVISKNFKGGEVVNVLGGTELNFMQSDIEDRAKLDISQVFGGTKMIIPANWLVKSDVSLVFGSVEDKRPTRVALEGEKEKVLVLTGDTVFGGIEILSY